MDDSHGNSLGSRKTRNRSVIVVRKVPADSVPFGPSITANGRTVWVAYEGERVVVVAPTADEACAKYRAKRARREL